MHYATFSCSGVGSRMKCDLRKITTVYPCKERDMKHTYSQIDMDERRKIARWRTAGISVDVIAERLHRHRSTIFRELRRNTFEDGEMPDLNGY